jgi:hypothetical protein
MGGVVAAVVDGAGVDAGVVVEEGLVASVGVADGAEGDVGAVEAGDGAVCAGVLDGVVGGAAEEERGEVGVGGLRAGRIALAVGWVAVVGEGGIADNAYGGREALEAACLALRDKDDEVGDLDVSVLTAGRIGCHVHSIPTIVSRPACCMATSSAI